MAVTSPVEQPLPARAVPPVPVAPPLPPELLADPPLEPPELALGAPELPPLEPPELEPPELEPPELEPPELEPPELPPLELPVPPELPLPFLQVIPLAAIAVGEAMRYRSPARVSKVIVSPELVKPTEHPSASLTTPTAGLAAAPTAGPNPERRRQGAAAH